MYMISAAHSRNLSYGGIDGGDMQSDATYAAAADFGVASGCMADGWCHSYLQFKAGECD